jgi:hypothetical protein
MTIKQLNNQYESICNQWIEKFCTKQDLDFDGWIADEVGGIASFACQYFFNLSDIILDLITKQPKGLIISWQIEDVDFYMSQYKEDLDFIFNININFRSNVMGLIGYKEKINYKSYTMGLRHDK